MLITHLLYHYFIFLAFFLYFLFKFNFFLFFLFFFFFFFFFHYYFFFFFFFSSRRRHTRLTCDWSSDVCSSDLMTAYHEELAKAGVLLDANGLKPSTEGWRVRYSGGKRTIVDGPFAETKELIRSEERRVGKECRSRGSQSH